jgi:pyridoxal 5'-phosphate synthase pdxT subunit
VGIKIGVLDLQGDVSEHIRTFRHALDRMGCAGNASVTAVRQAREIPGLDGLAIPGGESTTISRLIQKNGFFRPIQSFEGGIFATCAGMVMMATGVDDPRVQTLGLMDMTVIRNAFGRQKESFEADIDIKTLNSPFHAIFIRAPVVSRCGPSLVPVAAIDRGVVAVEDGLHMAFAFHPELGDDTRLHERFLGRIGG